ncbi:ATP synthase subunit O, mitochondrial-like [Neltuma alba]|uniref:ATP synthase subunit O, mitochondrial-like n=1 Tax=Neltuma alba TaxID=207710 RepID=UPI0010A31697|nr:ATP synthase subunit O, mitochondrial-like [Prosopis alba]
MALCGRIRSGICLVNKLTYLTSDSISAQRSTLPRSLITPFTSLDSRNYATASGKKDEKVKVPLALFGGSGNYASALYIAAVKANALEKVESEVLDFVEAIKKSPKFLQFTKDLSVPKDIRIKAIEEISKEAKFSDITKNFLVIVAENGRLRNLDTIVKKFSEVTMAHKGEVKAIVTTVIPLPPQEEKQLRETLQEIIGAGKKVHIEQKIDPSILGGLVVEFNQKVLDVSIKTRASQMERFLREPINIGDI